MATVQGYGWNFVLLPPFILDILKSDGLNPDPRTSFNLLLNVRVGNQITSMKLGENPKFFAQGYQGIEFIVAEQMMTLWGEHEGDSEWSIKKCLLGPMGAGKSYISWFLAAKAYAHGWPVLYIADAKILNDSSSEEVVSTKICERFLALNKDILTSRELGEMVNFQDKANPLVVSTCGHILGNLLQQQDRKTLFIIDEHGALFPDNKPATTTRFGVLGPLDFFYSWSPSKAGARDVFTGIALRKLERTLLRDSPEYLAIVGPLSLEVSNSLLVAISIKFHPTISQHVNNLRDEIQRITGRVPRELINLAKLIGTDSLAIQEVMQELQDLRRSVKHKFPGPYYLIIVS